MSKRCFIKIKFILKEKNDTIEVKLSNRNGLIWLQEQIKNIIGFWMFDADRIEIKRGIENYDTRE